MSPPGHREGRSSVAFVCDACSRPIYLGTGRLSVAPTCPHCEHEHRFLGTPAPEIGSPLSRCLRCGLDRLYTQKDFNKRIGIAVFVVAAVLSVPTWGLSLLAATIVDVGLYYMLGDVTICYGCNTQHRGFGRDPDHGPFDLHIAEAMDRQPRTI